MSAPTQPEVRAGQVWSDCERGRVRVIAVADGYAMLKRRRRNPFLASADQMQRGEYGWELVEDGSPPPADAEQRARELLDTAMGEYGFTMLMMPTPAYHRLIAAIAALIQQPEARGVVMDQVMAALEGREGWHDLTAKVQRMDDTLLLAGLCVQPEARDDEDEDPRLRYWRDRAVRAEAFSFSLSPGPGPQKGCRLDFAGNPMREVAPGIWQSAVAWPDTTTEQQPESRDAEVEALRAEVRDLLRWNGDAKAMNDGLGRMFREQTARAERLAGALRTWRGGKRPLGWDVAKHCANPAVNCKLDTEVLLAYLAAEEARAALEQEEGNGQ